MSQVVAREDMYIIGIGTSAGGLEALKSFFDHLPAKCPHAFVVIQHLSPDYKSLMAELLAKNTDLVIHEVTDHMTIEAGSLYLLPPRKNMTIQGDQLLLADKPNDTRLNLPIDIFFRSLAAEKGEKAIGIILTGTGSDGTRGVRAIKEVGGMVMVQSPAQAKFDGMPQSAIQTGLVDYTLPVEELPEELLSFIKYLPVREGESKEMVEDEESLLQLLHHVRSVTELDFVPYKRPTLVRRIIRRMGIHKLHTFREYLSFLLEHPEETETLVSEFLIGVTKFFRDESVWELLEKEYIPALVESKGPDESMIKCWVVGCSTGEEAYSLAILLYEESRRQNKKFDIRIFATDIQVDSLSRASKGLYTASAVADVSPERLESFFFATGGCYQIIEPIRNMVVFSKHNILFDTPFSRMDLVCCRNLLIYVHPVYQSKALTSLHYALKRGGFLLLGSSETVAGHENVLHEVHRKARIYRNVHPATHLAAKGFSMPYQHVSLAPKHSRHHAGGLDELLFSTIGDVLADELGFVGVLVDEKFFVKRVVGEFRRYVELPERGFSAQLLQIVPKRLASVIRTGVFKAKRTAKRVRYENVFVGGEERLVVSLLVTPLQVGEDFPLQFLVGWVPATIQTNVSVDDIVVDEGISKRRIAELETELEDSHTNLRATIEKLELSNEELQVTNEELLATNEELQSTNEELQSVNEELHTVNMEHKFKLEQLETLHAEMDNLLRSTQIGTLFLDRSMRIRRLTPAIQKQFNLEESDVGRPLAHFTSVFGEEQIRYMLEQAANVLKEKSPVQYELQSVGRESTWYVVRIHPFYDGTKFVDGVVFSFVDIGEQKRAEQQLREQDVFMSTVLSTQPSIVYVYDLDTQSIVYANEAMYALLGHSPQEIEAMGNELFATIIYPEDLPHVLAKEDELRNATDEDIIEVVYRIQHADGQKRFFRSYERVFKRHPDGSVRQKLGVANDETEAHRVNAELRANEAKLQTVFSSMPATITIFQSDGLVLYVNRLVDGIDMEEYIGSSVFDWLPPNISQSLRDNMDIVQKTREPRFYENDYVEPKGQNHHFYHILSLVPTEEREKDIFVVISQETTDLKVMEKELRKQRDQLAAKNKELEQFAYIAAHDLQEPLRTVSGFAGLISEQYEGTFDEVGQEMFYYLRTAADRMSLLIKALLDYSLIGKERVFEDVDCSSIISDVLLDLEPRIQAANACVDVGELPCIQGVGAEFQVLFRNLLGNALKFARKGVPARVSVHAEESELEWLFSVRDNGIGIESQFLEQIFLIFQRLHPSHEFEGVGIGLAHCAKIVSLYGGRIWVESVVGEGSVFSFSIPKYSQTGVLVEGVEA